MKKETIVKYLRFLSDSALGLKNDDPDGEDLQQMQVEHLRFLDKLKEDSSMDKSFIWELEELDLGVDIQTAEMRRGIFTPFINALPFGAGTVTKHIGKDLARIKLDEYHHRLCEIAEKYDYGFLFI